MVEYIRRRGDYAIVSDFYQMEQSPAKQLAHEHWEISTQDLELLYGKLPGRKCTGNSGQYGRSQSGKRDKAFRPSGSALLRG